jgi:hypothetical protein
MTMWQATYTTTSPIVLQNVGRNIDSIMLLRHQQYYCINMWLSIHSFTSVFSIGISKNRLPTVLVSSTSCTSYLRHWVRITNRQCIRFPLSRLSVLFLVERGPVCRGFTSFVSPYRKTATWYHKTDPITIFHTFRTIIYNKLTVRDMSNRYTFIKQWTRS